MRCGLAILLLVIISLANADINQKTNDKVEKKRMVGVDTIHDVKIDKDAVITRNAVFQKKNTEKPALHDKPVSVPGANKQADDPDWSYKGFPQEVSSHVHQFKKNMTECLKEVQANDKRPIKRLSPKTESPVHGECLIACVLKRNGVIERGKINKDNLLTLVSKFYAKDTKLMKKLEKNVDRCIEASFRIRGDECALANQLNSCTNDLMASNKHKIIVNYK